SAYFVDLVAFNQATTSSERNAAYDRLKSHRRYRDAHRLELAHADYHATWYLPAIRELAARPDFTPDPVRIARCLRPRITEAEAERALRVLQDLELLVPGPDGRLVQADALVSTGPETRGLHIGNYHRMMMKRAAASIDEVPPDQRDISSLTLCLGPEKLAELKVRVQRFRRELLELSAEEADPKDVIQLNFQLFPLTDCESETDT